MKNTTLKLAENDYLILEYLKLNHSATEKSIISALNNKVEGIKFRLENLSTRETVQRQNGTRRSVEAYISRMNQGDSRVYSLNSKGEAELQNYNTQKKNEKREFWLKNALIPVIVSFLTTSITMYLIPKLPSILKWLCDTLSKNFSS